MSEALQGRFPGRVSEIGLLLGFLRYNDEPVPPLYVYGHTATGKTSLTLAILEELKVRHVIVDCIECFTERLLCERILNQLSGKLPSLANGYQSAVCPTLNDLVWALRDVPGDATIYLVFDKAERLRELGSTIVPALLRLDELAERNICTILISELVWEKLRSDTGEREPIPIHFSDYGREAMLEIIGRDCPADEEPSFFKQFVGRLYDVCVGSCQDLNELRHLVRLLFPKYREPVEKGEATRRDVGALYKHITPYFKKVLDKIYLRELSQSDWARVGENPEGFNRAEAESKLGFDLPVLTKYLLVAAYLASYNPAKFDARFFTHQTQPGKGRKTNRTRKSLVKQALRGPKAFPLERLLAIFQSILDEPVDVTAEILQSVSSLVTLNLLRRVSNDGVLHNAKYQCNVGEESILSVCRGLGMDLKRYLYDEDA